MLLQALIRVPVSVVQQVGFIFVLFRAVIEAMFPTTGGAPSSSASIAGRAAATAAHDSSVVTEKERK